MDVLWFRAARATGDDEETLGRFDPGRVFIRINRGDYWQCAYVIAKGSFEAVKANGVDAFKADAARLIELPIERLERLKSFDDVSLLSVAVDRLERWWRPGSWRSATPPTRCRRSAASASISRCRTRSPPPIASPRLCWRERSATRSGRRRKPAIVSHPSHSVRAGQSAEQHHRPDARRGTPIKTPFAFASCRASRLCVNCSAGSSAWACAPSTCKPRKPQPQGEVSQPACKPGSVWPAALRLPT